MGIITPLLDVVAGVAILAGRSSLLDTGVFKTANTNFTIRHILAWGFIGVGVWNLWKIERVCGGNTTYAKMIVHLSYQMKLLLAIPQCMRIQTSQNVFA